MNILWYWRNLSAVLFVCAGQHIRIGKFLSWKLLREYRISMQSITREQKKALFRLSITCDFPSASFCWPRSAGATEPYYWSRYLVQKWRCNLFFSRDLALFKKTLQFSVKILIFNKFSRKFSQTRKNFHYPYDNKISSQQAYFYVIGSFWSRMFVPTLRNVSKSTKTYQQHTKDMWIFSKQNF